MPESSEIPSYELKLSDYIAQFLIDRGVTDIFMLTGNGAMYLNDAIGRSKLNFFCARNEATAPMMAEAYARVKQSLGAVCVTSGPGSTNAVPGLAEAWVDSAPVMIISGQVQRDHTTQAANIEGLRSLGTQEINILPIVKPLTKYAVMVEEPETIRYHLEKAYHLATSGRPGPVWLDIPMDIQYAEIDPESLKGFEPDSLPPIPHPSRDDVASVIELLRNAKRPLVVAGHGVRQANAIPAMRQFIESNGLPVIFSRMGQDMLSHDHWLNMGQAGIKGSKYSASIMREADVVLTLGCRLAIQFVGHNMDAFSPDARVVMVDIDPAELSKNGVPLELALLADVNEFLEALLANLGGSELPDWSSWVGRCADLKDRNPMVTPEQQRDPIDLYYFMQRLDAISDERHIFVTDAGSNYYIGGQVLRFNAGQREITSGCFASMGLSIPLAIGASVAAPNSQILAITGDGSLELNVQELKTMSHYNCDIKLFVINNGGYASMRNWQDGYFEGRRIESEETTGSGTLDFRKIADAFGLPYAIIDRWNEIDADLTEILSQKGPMFVEVVCDTNQKIVEPIKDLSFNVAHV